MQIIIIIIIIIINIIISILFCAYNCVLVLSGLFYHFIITTCCIFIWSLL